MANFYTDNDDLRFYVERGIDWEPLLRHREGELKEGKAFASVDEAKTFFEDILTLVGKFVAEDLDPHVTAIDEHGAVHKDGEVTLHPTLESVMSKAAEMGLHGMCIPRELGGMNAPELLNHLHAELFGRADVSVMAHHGFHAGIAMVLLYYSMEEGTTEWDPETRTIKSTRWENAIREILSGKAWGSMDITEPDAGSDMAALRTRATLDADGIWRLTGQKIFITSGHGKYHVVIARSESEKSAGLEGLSLFLVKTYIDEPDGTRTRLAQVERVEEKTGHHASATCTMAFEDTPAELIGNRGEGFRYMLKLMNGARVGVGFECLALCEAATRLAKEYAAERVSMGKAIADHELIASYLAEMELKTRAIRAMAVQAAWEEEMSRGLKLEAKYETDELESERLRKQSKVHEWNARTLTPLLKYQAAEDAVYISRMGVQIHGGVGYTTEYGAEKLIRDALGMPIYEGTSQIQSLMVMKDKLQQVMKAPQAFVREIAQTRWRKLGSTDSITRQVAKLEDLGLKATQTLLVRSASRKMKGVPVTQWTKQLFTDWDPKRDFAFAMLHAESLTKIWVQVEIARILGHQAREHEDRWPWFEAWVEQAEPLIRFELDKIQHTGNRILKKLHGTSSEEDTVTKEA